MKEEIVIVSGGANGLGLELLRKAHKRGFFVCNIDWDKKQLERVDKEFGSERYVSFYGDISDEDFVKKTIKEISKLGRIAYLFNNAGEPSFVLPTENTKKVVETTFRGLFGMIYLTSQVLKDMEKTGGKIVNIMSSAALKGNKQESAYCATKWGERGFTESLKTAYRSTNVKIIGVYPGGIDTAFYKNSRDYVSSEKQKTFMNPSEVAEIIVSNAMTDSKLCVSDIVIERV